LYNCQIVPEGESQKIPVRAYKCKIQCAAFYISAERKMYYDSNGKPLGPVVEKSGC
jgi:hypothetical protein